MQKKQSIVNVRKIMLGICTCKCDKDFDIREYSIDWTCMVSLVDDPSVTCDEIVDKSETSWIKPNDKTIGLLL